MAIKLVRIRPGAYVADSGHNVDRHTRTYLGGYTRSDWVVSLDGTVVGEGSTLAEARREIEADIAQRAAGLR